MIFEVSILGSSSATPIYQRHPSAQVVNIHERFFLVDCGEGTLIQMNRYKIKFHRISHIFISHLHGDHYLGLLGLISTMHLQGRTASLNVYGPAKLKEIIDIQLDYSETELRYPLVFHPLDATTPACIYNEDNVEVHTIILNHRIPCTGFMFIESHKLRKLNKERVEEHGIPVEFFHELKNGKDFVRPDGTIIPNSQLTLPPPPDRRYAYCSDTIYDERLIGIVRGVDLLYHEATFMDDRVERARETYHSTARQAGIIARNAGVQRLIIGHFSARYKNLYPLLDEAKSEFNQVTLALEGDRFSI